MNNNADTDFLRFLAREQYGMNITDGLAILDEAKRLFAVTATPNSPVDEGVVWRGILFTPLADAHMSNGKKILAIKEVRQANVRGITPDYRYNWNEVTGNLGLKDAKEIVEARMAHMGWPLLNW